MKTRSPIYADRLPNGNLSIPVRGELPGGAVVRTRVEIGPDDPRWAEWQDFINEPEPPTAKRPPAARTVGRDKSIHSPR